MKEWGCWSTSVLPNKSGYLSARWALLNAGYVFGSNWKAEKYLTLLWSLNLRAKPVVGWKHTGEINVYLLPRENILPQRKGAACPPTTCLNYSVLWPFVHCCSASFIQLFLFSPHTVHSFAPPSDFGASLRAPPKPVKVSFVSITHWSDQWSCEICR